MSVEGEVNSHQVLLRQQALPRLSARFPLRDATIGRREQATQILLLPCTSAAAHLPYYVPLPPSVQRLFEVVYFNVPFSPRLPPPSAPSLLAASMGDSFRSLPSFTCRLLVVHLYATAAGQRYEGDEAHSSATSYFLYCITLPSGRS